MRNDVSLKNCKKIKRYLETFSLENLIIFLQKQFFEENVNI